MKQVLRILNDTMVKHADGLPLACCVAKDPISTWVWSSYVRQRPLDSGSHKANPEMAGLCAHLRMRDDAFGSPRGSSRRADHLRDKNRNQRVHLPRSVMMATMTTHSPMYTEATRFPDFVPLGKEVLREIALATRPQHDYVYYNHEEHDDGYDEGYDDDDRRDLQEELYASYDEEDPEDEPYDGKKETTAQGEAGVWREVPVVDQDGEPTDDTEFVFELLQGKSFDEISLEQAHRAAMSSLEGQAIEDIDFEAIEKLKQEITPVQAAEIDATIERKHRAKAAFTGKDAGRIEVFASAGVSSAEAATKRVERERVAELVKQAELTRKKQLSDHNPRPVKVTPCAAVFRRGQWCNPCACSRGKSCTWAHSPAELRAANDAHICGYDSGKGLCSKGRCMHRHTVPTGACSCGLRDLWVGTRRVFKGKGNPPGYVDTTAAILCSCPRRPETDAELAARCGRCLRSEVSEALAAPAWVRRGNGRQNQPRRQDQPRRSQNQPRRQDQPRRSQNQPRRRSQPKQPTTKDADGSTKDADGWEQVPKHRRR